MVGLRGKVRAGVERLTRVIEKHTHRPSTPPGQCGRRVHVDGIYIGAFFAIHLDADEVFIEKIRCR